MSESKHTPGPWKQSDIDPALVVNCNALDVADCRSTFRNPSVSTEERIANAKFIVRACNTHDDLVAALQFVLDHIADPARGFRDLYPAFGLDSTRALEVVRAAINKADGRS